MPLEDLATNCPHCGRTNMVTFQWIQNRVGIKGAYRVECPLCDESYLVGFTRATQVMRHPDDPSRPENRRREDPTTIGDLDGDWDAFKSGTRPSELSDDADPQQPTRTEGSVGGGTMPMRSGPSPNDNRSNALNPNNASSQAAANNRSNQMNPNNPANRSSRGRR